jgi:hypothetical protein
MAVGRQKPDLTAKPGNRVGAKTTTGPSNRKATTGKLRAKKGSTTEHEQRTEAGNGPTENTRIHKNHLSVFYYVYMDRK